MLPTHLEYFITTNLKGIPPLSSYNPRKIMLVSKIVKILDKWRTHREENFDPDQRHVH